MSLLALVGLTGVCPLRLAANCGDAGLHISNYGGQFQELSLLIFRLLLTSSLVRLTTFSLLCGNDSLAIFFTSALPVTVITGVNPPLQIVDAAAVATTLVRASTATVGSTGLNSGNLAELLILSHLQNGSCKVVSVL